MGLVDGLKWSGKGFGRSLRDLPSEIQNWIVDFVRVVWELQVRHLVDLWPWDSFESFGYFIRALSLVVAHFGKRVNSVIQQSVRSGSDTYPAYCFQDRNPELCVKEALIGSLQWL